MLAWLRLCDLQDEVGTSLALETIDKWLASSSIVLAFMRLALVLRQLAEGDADRLMVAELDRLARSTIDAPWRSMSRHALG